MDRRALSFAILVILSGVLVGVTCEVANASPTPEARIGNAINTFRHQHGRSYLVRTKILDRLAEYHSAQMGGNYRTFEVTGVVDIVDTARPYHLLEDTVREWIRSTFRKRLLRSDWNRMGVGVVRSYGVYWVTVVFRG